MHAVCGAARRHALWHVSAPVARLQPSSRRLATVDSPAAAAAAAPAPSEKKGKGQKPSWAPLKGMHDYSSPAVARHRSIESAFSDVCSTFSYGEVRTPLLERSDLFSRTLGAASDVVSKEMFAFDDHGVWSVLRPEATASVARMLLDTGLGSLSLPARMYYHGPMFRRERPQAGRQRQFSQFGVELVGASEIQADVEVIQAAQECLRRIGVEPYVTLQLNTLGDSASRAAYVQVLSTFLTGHLDQLSADSKTRLERGSVLRILDSKDAGDQKLIQEGAPRLEEHLNEVSRTRWIELQRALDVAGVKYVKNPFLVRGLDYYSHSCFEFVLNPSALASRLASLGSKVRVPAQSTVLAGGRYDGLFETLGGPNTPAVGWAAGIDRLILLQDMIQTNIKAVRRPMPIGVVGIEENQSNQKQPATATPTPSSSSLSVGAAHSALCTYIRRGCSLDVADSSSPSSSSSSSPFVSSSSYSVVRSFHSTMSKQLKYLSRPSLLEFSGSVMSSLRYVILIGEEEIRMNQIKLKDMNTAEQTTIKLGDLAKELAARREGPTATTNQTEETNEQLTYAQLCEAADIQL